MFCDLVGATEISARLDPEEWREIEADYLSVAEKDIARFGGHVAKYVGDGVLAYFGWPEAHDNDAECAARAGLAIVDAVGVLNQSEGYQSRPKLSVRVGIDSGTVVIGQGGGSDSEVFGDTANIASRAQSAADPDTVIVTPAVHRLISGMFVIEERGVHQLKGIAEPVELYRIVRLSGARSRLAASAGRGLTAFVGRADEMGLLWNRWESASEGEGQVVFIVGEAGIGKSRLVRQFRERLAGNPHTWNECSGASCFQNTPFYPIVDMLRQAFAQRGDETDGAKLGELERVLELAGLKLAEAVPLVAPMLNIQIGERYPQLTLSPEQKRKRLLATLAGWLFGVARAQPVAMAVEDLHWLDASTLELMQLLVEQGATSPLLLLTTARPEFQAPWKPRAHHTHLTLNRLSARDVRELVGQVVASRALSGEAIDRVIERTGGVPLFVEELTRAVLEKGDAKPDPHEIPATLHDSLMARLDRLGPAKEVAQIASVIGREFSYELLLAVSTVPEDDLRSALAKLEDSELVYARGIPPEANYSFKHALIQDTAYEALLKSRRRELHRRVAVAMTEKFPALAETQLELVARHWTDGGEVEPAIIVWRKAGDASFERCAFKEAEKAYQQALELIPLQVESSERNELELSLMVAFVQTLQVTRGYSAPETATAVTRAQALAEKNNRLAQLIPQVTNSLATVMTQGDLQAGSVLGGQLLDLAERDGSPANLVTAHVSQVFIRLFRGDFLAAEEHFAMGTAFFEPATNYPPGVAAGLYGYASLNAWVLGRTETASIRIRSALAVARDHNGPFELAFAHFLAATLYIFLRQPTLAETSAQQSIEISHKYGFPYWAAMSEVTLGRARAAIGNANEAVGQVRGGLARLAELETRINITLFLSWLAEAEGINGAISEAFVAIEEALDANPSELAWRADALRIRGELRLKSSHLKEAETDFRAAIALAQKIGAKAWELRAAMSLAGMLRKRGNLTEARDLLTPLYASFTEGFDTADLKKAKTLLDELKV
ncbi:MAG: AAA family ATPase [Candidatus Binataceae bacterium]